MGNDRGGMCAVRYTVTGNACRIWWGDHSCGRPIYPDRTFQPTPALAERYHVEEAADYSVVECYRSRAPDSVRGFGIMAHAFIALAPAMEWFAGIGLLLLSAALLADTSSQQQ